MTNSFASPSELQTALAQDGYLADEGLATALFVAMSLPQPLLLEGEAGVGKTQAAKSLAALLNTPLIRLQCYEGIDASEALYEWNYPQQLLGIRVAESQGKPLTEESLFRGLEKAVAGNRLTDISHAIQTHAESFGYGVVREFVGHGVGKVLHEDPQIPNYGLPGKGALLKPGMTLAIEPMINQGRKEVKVLKDNWTAVTVDRKMSAHFEHTILVTKGDYIILTAL